MDSCLVISKVNLSGNSLAQRGRLGGQDVNLLNKPLFSSLWIWLPSECEVTLLKGHLKTEKCKLIIKI